MKNAHLCFHFFMLGFSSLCAPAYAASNEEVRAAAEQFLQAHARVLPGTARIEVAAPSGQSPVLTTCTQLEAFIPNGQPRWGRMSIGVRCQPPGKGSVYVAARLTLTGNYLVITHPLLAGQALSETDFRIEQGELSAQPADVLTSSVGIPGRKLRQPLSTGQVLRQAYLQASVTLRPGQEVKVIAHGAGFSVSNTGFAINVAALGEMARVKLGDGRIVVGTVRGEGLVEVNE